MARERAVFTNWVGNQSCAPARILAPTSEADVQAAVRTAREVRCVATGHSFTPVHLTDDTLLTMDGLHGVLRVDPRTASITALPGTSVGALGEPLWDAGLSLANQGDIDTQGIAGAISTSPTAPASSCSRSRPRCGAPGWSSRAATCSRSAPTTRGSRPSRPASACSAC